MSHKTLINGTGYEIKGGRTLIGGTGYAIKKGRTLVGGTGYDISFGTPISSLSVGSSVWMNVNGVQTEFIIVHHGNPNPSLYDASCNGTWLMTKLSAPIGNIAFNSNYDCDFSTSDMFRYMNETYLNQFEAKIRNIIKRVKLPYTTDGTTVMSLGNGVSCKIFCTNYYETGYAPSGRQTAEDGSKLDYFELGETTSAKNKRICYRADGNAIGYWTRTLSSRTYAWIFNEAGTGTNRTLTFQLAIRPFLILPLDAKIDDNFNIVA